MRRRRWVLAVSSVAILSSVAVLMLATRSATTARPAAPSSPTATGPATSAPTVAPPYAVDTLSLVVTEPATATEPARSFTTNVRYPAPIRGPGGHPQDAPHGHAGTFPLLVFSGGYGISPEAYATLLDAWAAAGFVVADPDYPLTDPAAGRIDEGDIVHHPGDLSAVITAITAADRGSGGGAGAALAGVVDTAAVAVAGHSDGGDVSLAAVADTCCRDPRIGAAVILSGAEDTAFGGSYFTGVPALPLLVVQGTADTVNPPGCSLQLYDQAAPPRYFLGLTGQSHQSPYLDAGPVRDTVQQVVVDFLLGTLEGSATAEAAMARDGNIPGSSSLTVDTAPAASPSSCPGAPAS